MVNFHTQSEQYEILIISKLHCIYYHFPHNVSTLTSHGIAYVFQLVSCQRDDVVPISYTQWHLVDFVIFHL